MKRVTRNINPDSAQDLLKRPARACLCFATDRGPQAQPVALVWQDGRYLVSMPEQTEPQPASGQEVVLLIDEGIHYFDLRALYIRGQVKPALAPRGAQTSRRWWEVVPLKMVAWDYGMMREVRDEH
jgi:hypothetical protein